MKRLGFILSNGNESTDVRLPAVGPFNDLHIFNTSSGLWVAHTMGNAPAARYGHGFVAAGGELYVFGGCSAGGKQPIKGF